MIDYQHIKLESDKQIALAQLYGSPAYESVLDVLEGECQKLETELLRLGPEKSDGEVRNLLSECRAARKLLERFEQEVLFHVGLAQPQEPIHELTDEQLAATL